VEVLALPLKVAVPHSPVLPRIAPVLAAALTAILLAGCTAPAGLTSSDDRVQVVTTTGLLKDLVDNVGGDRVAVSSMVPDGADPHSYEPTLRGVRDVVYADVAFSNYMLLEEHNIIKTLDANLRDGVPNISLAEGAVKYAAEIIPLVENVSLDTVWLGLRARGDGEQFGATRSSDVLLSATSATGPGDVFGYLTGSFGDTDVYFDSSDGFDAGTGYRDDTATLPADAHTHMSCGGRQHAVVVLRTGDDCQGDVEALETTPARSPEAGADRYGGDGQHDENRVGGYSRHEFPLSCVTGLIHASKGNLARVSPEWYTRFLFDAAGVPPQCAFRPSVAGSG